MKSKQFLYTLIVFVLAHNTLLSHPGFSEKLDTGGDTIRQKTAQLSMKWIEPINEKPVMYEKIEWEIQMPTEVRIAVENWISNDKNGTHHTPAINPFNPDELNLFANVIYFKEEVQIVQPVFGFFYQEFDRITQDHNPEHVSGMEDPNKWYWQEKNATGSFLIRWSAEIATTHRVNIKLDVPSIGKWELAEFSFNSVQGDQSKSFIHVSENQHYFKTDDGNLFLPLGINITEASFGCNCQEGVEPTGDCDKCYEWASNDPCCGIDVNKKLRAGMKGTTLKEYSVAAAAYIKLEKVLNTLKASGANAFRTFFDPMAFDVEFEKINNYYDRQYQAWEFDQLLEVCHDLDLRMELNMQYHNSMAYHLFGYDRFDWDDQYNCMGCGKDTRTTGTNGWCYFNGCPEMDSPLKFLTSPCAQSNYKKKLRYIIARWGYSRNIYVMELMSEMNNVGVGSIWEVNIDTDGDGQKDDMKEHAYPGNYYEDPKNRVAVANWHNEMARYIKEDLHHSRHLIAADYTGQAPMDADLNRDGDCTDADIGENCNPCQSSNFDYSWQSHYIDVIAFSNYSGSLNRWEKMSLHEYFKNSQSNGLMCGWNDPTNRDDEGKYNSPLGSYESLWKPVIHAENGFTICMESDYTGFLKDMLTDVFGGHATSGMSWDEWSNSTHWSNLNQIKTFLNTHVQKVADFGTGPWKPDHVYSVNKTENRKTQFAEAVYMTQTSNNRSVGFVMNRSWNYYTQCPGSCQAADRKNDFQGSNEPLSRMTPVDWNSDRVFLRDFPSGKYRIQYFDPISGNQISEVTRKSNRNRLGLEDYPLLGDGKNSNQPYCFFIVTKI